MLDLKIKARLLGGPCDGLDRDVRENCERLDVPFMCGADFCIAGYRRLRVLDDGSIEMEHIGDKHRNSERLSLFAGLGWRSGICRPYAESDEGKEFIAMMEAKGA